MSKKKKARDRMQGTKKTQPITDVIPGFPDSASTITKGEKADQSMSEEIIEKAKVSPFEEKDFIEQEKEPAEKTEEVKKTAIIEEDMEKAKSKIGGIFVSLKEVSSKVAVTIGKTLKSEKLDISKSVDITVAALKHPVDTITTLDKKVTKSMKKVIKFCNKNVGDNIVVNNIKTTDMKINRSVKKFTDSISKE